MGAMENFLNKRGKGLKPPRPPQSNGNQLNTAAVIELCKIMLADFGYIVLDKKK